MVCIPLLEASVAIGGRPNKNISPLQFIHHVTQQSQDVQIGSLFVALKGKRHDGHSFVKEAENSGAIAAVVEFEVSGVKIPQLIVPSSQLALGNLAKIWKGRFQIPTIAVTGSVGKTSTKDIIAHILEGKFSPHKSRENFNNELGVPIELMRLEQGHDCSVIELAMRDINQINYLSKIARPTIGVITNVGMSHIEILKTRKNIARAKAEILEGMDYEGLLILNRDDDYYEFVKEKSLCNVMTFGEHHESDVRISDIKLNYKGSPTFKLNGFPVSMNQSTGKHQAFNAAIGYLIGLHLGMTPLEIAKRMQTYKTSKRRGIVIKGYNGALIFDSSYNAAPDSIKSSLYTLSELSKRQKRSIAVIGDMLELGEHSIEAHEHIGEIVGRINDLELLVTVGTYSKCIGEIASVRNWVHFTESRAAAIYLLEYVQTDHHILIQGSNGISLDLVVDSLKNGVLKVTV